MGGNSILSAVESFVGRHRLFLPGEKVVAAVSGGPDSVALLDILSRLDLGLQLSVAHLNHMLRGRESDEEEEFVASLAARYGLSFRSASVDVRGEAAREHLSLEDAARRARYRFLKECAENFGARVAALGHHGDDQAETLLLRLLRGAGSRGLSGMSPASAWKVRPLLGLFRSDIERYVEERGLPFRVDPSNRDLRFTRNRIRHRLLPQLAEYNPSIAQTLVRTASSLAGDHEFLEGEAAASFASLARVSGTTTALGLEELRPLAMPFRLRLYRMALGLLPQGENGFDQLERIDALVFSGKKVGRLSLAGGTVSLEYERLVFHERGAAEDAASFSIDRFGTFPAGGALLAVSPSEGGVAHTPSGAAIVDLAAAPFPWTVRSFRPGDRIFPLGMEGSKKVKEVFIDEKVPLRLRRSVPLLFDGSGNLLWICGIRRGRYAPVTAATTMAARVELLPAPGQTVVKTGAVW